jgi:hypothetical protein
VRRRALESASETRRRAADVELAPPRARRPTSRRAARSSTTSSRCARARARAARLRDEERLRRRRDRRSPAASTRRSRRARVEALGAERVHGVSMPSRYSSTATRGDAERSPRALGIDFREIAIEEIVGAVRRGALPRRSRARRDLTEENLQARIRGTLLMALSNKFGWLVIATGNKSELSVGYSTLYGDLAGGFALIKDVYKTDVFRLARWLNERAGRELIPLDHRARAERRAARRPARRGLAAAVRAARRGARGLRRARPLARGAAAGRLRPGGRRAGARDDRPRRVQAPPGPARREAPAEGVRPRPADADHEPLESRREGRASACEPAQSLRPRHGGVRG